MGYGVGAVSFTLQPSKTFPKTSSMPQVSHGQRFQCQQVTKRISSHRIADTLYTPCFSPGPVRAKPCHTLWPPALRLANAQSEPKSSAALTAVRCMKNPHLLAEWRVQVLCPPEAPKVCLFPRTFPQIPRIRQTNRHHHLRMDGLTRNTSSVERRPP